MRVPVLRRMALRPARTRRPTRSWRPSGLGAGSCPGRGWSAGGRRAPSIGLGRPACQATRQRRIASRRRKPRSRPGDTDLDALNQAHGTPAGLDERFAAMLEEAGSCDFVIASLNTILPASSAGERPHGLRRLTSRRVRSAAMRSRPLSGDRFAAAIGRASRGTSTTSTKPGG
jgi:hypothetical protein